MGRTRKRGVALSGCRPVLAAITTVVLGLTAMLAAAAPASAGLRNDLQEFSNCPLTAFGVSKCVVSRVTSGEFVLGKATVPITVPVVIRGGLGSEGEIIAPTSGPTLSRSPEPIPGGLLGIELPGNFTEVAAVAELAATASISNAVHLPLKTKLENLALGPNCYVGSNAEPINLELFFGSNFKTTVKDHAIDDLEGSLETHSFSAPGASGCTIVPFLGDLLVDLKEGLPSPSGNAAVLTGETEEVSRRLVREVLPLPAFSRCEKLASKTGVYTNSGCTANSIVNEGNFEWLDGPGASRSFTGTSGGVTLQTAGARTLVKCAASAASGEYTGPKTETETITLSGCASGPKGHTASCQSVGSGSGEVKTALLEGGLDFIKENEQGVKPEVGLELHGASGSQIAALECGGSHISVTGSVIAPITPVDSSVSAFKLTAKQTNGTQAVTSFEEGAKAGLTITGSSGTEAGGLAIAETQTNGEKLEVKGEA